MGSCSPIPTPVSTPISEVRTVCVSSASTGPCGGQRVNRCPYRDRPIGGALWARPGSGNLVPPIVRLRLAALWGSNWRVTNPPQVGTLPHIYVYFPTSTKGAQ